MYTYLKQDALRHRPAGPLCCRKGKKEEECPRCAISRTNAAGELEALCTRHQLEVVLVEQMQVQGVDTLISQLCTPHQPCIRGSPGTTPTSGPSADGEVMAAGMRPDHSQQLKGHAPLLLALHVSSIVTASGKMSPGIVLPVGSPSCTHRQSQVPCCTPQEVCVASLCNFAPCECCIRMHGRRCSKGCLETAVLWIPPDSHRLLYSGWGSNGCEQHYRNVSFSTSVECLGHLAGEAQIRMAMEAQFSAAWWPSIPLHLEEFTLLRHCIHLMVLRLM